MEENENYVDYIVAYFDVLGYKSFFENKNTVKKDLLESMLKITSDILIKTPALGNLANISIKTKTFSDNFVIMIRIDDNTSIPSILRLLIFLLAQFQVKFLEEHSLLIRGAITRGLAYIDENMVFGEALIKAVELENIAEFPRILLDYNCFSNEIVSPILMHIIEKDTDDKYFINPFKTMLEPFSEGVFLFGDVDTRLTKINSNIRTLIVKNGKFHHLVTDPQKIIGQERVITKHVWLLLKFNEFCTNRNYEKLNIEYSCKLNERLLRFQVEV